MRATVLLLLVANALLFAYVQFGRSSGREPDRLSDQLNPEAIRLLDAREAAALGVARSPAREDASHSPAAQPPPSASRASDAGTTPRTAAPTTGAKLPDAGTPPPDAGATPTGAGATPTDAGATPPAAEATGNSRTANRSAQACLEWGPFSNTERARAENDVAALAPGVSPIRRPVHLSDAWWVNVGALAARADADKRASDLNAKTIDDLSVVDYGESKFTVSLGVYRTEAAATARARALAVRGVAGLRVEPWKQPITLTMLVVRDPLQSAVAKFAELQARYPGTELRAVSCAAAS